jgi:CRP-like cAMP-binding protein
MKELFCSAGDLILSRNDISGSVYMIIRGKVRIEIESESFFLSDGDLFGEEGLFFNKLSPYNAVSVEETSIQVLNEEEARDHIFQNPEVSFTVFMKNFGRVWRNIRPFSKNSSSYIRVLEELIPYSESTDSGEVDAVAKIGISELAKVLKIDPQSFLEDFKRYVFLGQIDVKGGEKILTADKSVLQRTVYEYYRKNYFSGTYSEKGTGEDTLVNLLGKRNETIFNGKMVNN